MDTKEFREARQRMIDWIAENLDSSALGLKSPESRRHSRAPAARIRRSR